MRSRTRSDPSNGYEAASEQFMAHRSRSTVGLETVRNWAGRLPPGAAVLDLGCGHGVPISQALVDEGLTLYGIDASPSMMAAFRARFPDAPAECGTVEDSRFFGRTFDGVVAWGLVFLLSADTQRHLIERISSVLVPGGRFLFTSPRQASEWPDVLTKQTSRSLGSDSYRSIAESCGLSLENEVDDDEKNHYYFFRKSRAGRWRTPN